MQIAKNKYFEIRIDKDKNRVYLKIKGFWQIDDPEVKEYNNYWKRTAFLMKKNFTILIDSSEAKTHTQKIQKLREEAQKIALKKGISKTAEFVSKNIIAEYQSDTMSNNTKLPKNKFLSFERAEEYLDNFL